MMHRDVLLFVLHVGALQKAGRIDKAEHRVLDSVWFVATVVNFGTEVRGMGSAMKENMKCSWEKVGDGKYNLHLESQKLLKMLWCFK